MGWHALLVQLRWDQVYAALHSAHRLLPGRAWHL
jgi:hypothetical protein